MKKANYLISMLILISLLIGVSLFLFISKQSKDFRAKAGSANTTLENKSTPEQILFVSYRTGNYEIYWMDLATQETINLTNNAHDDMNPQISPDGQLVAFYSNRDGDNEIYQMHLQTHALVQLTDNDMNDYDPSYSPDGKQIVFKSTRYDRMGDIFVMNVDGSEQRNLTTSRNTTEEWDPTFSNDGKYIYFTSRTDSDPNTDNLFVMNADGSDIKQLTHNTVPDWYVSINPKTDALLFISKRTLSQKDDLFMSASDGTDRLRLTSLTGNDADPAWNTLGDKIIFINDADGDYDIFTMNADGKNIVKIEDSPTDELAPIFLP